MRVLEMTARTPEEAIEIALRELGVDRGEVEVDIVSRGKPGLFGFGSEPARVRVTLLEKPPDVVMVTTTVLQDLISRMGAVVVASLKRAHSDASGGPVFEIEGEDAGLLIGRRGETLRALQFMVNMVVRHRLPGMDSRITVDVAGYQERRASVLTNLAIRVAQRVERSGRSIVLEPMPANERRIVHLALANHPRVSTESMGEGDTRQVVVQPRPE